MVKLSVKEVQRMVDTASRTISRRDFMRGCDGVPDGTKARIVLRSGKQIRELECIGAGQWPRQKTAAAALLEQINRKLPADARVY